MKQFIELEREILWISFRTRYNCKCCVRSASSPKIDDDDVCDQSYFGSHGMEWNQMLMCIATVCVYILETLCFIGFGKMNGEQWAFMKSLTTWYMCLCVCLHHSQPTLSCFCAFSLWQSTKNDQLEFQSQDSLIMFMILILLFWFQQSHFIISRMFYIKKYFWIYVNA